MKCLILTIVLVALFALAHGSITTTPFGDVDTTVPTAILVKLKDPQAKCLDGSPGSFYYLPAPEGSENADKWIFYKQGGGVCTDGASCLWRSKTFLGSSTVLSPTKTKGFSGILSRNCSISPELCTYNLVFLNYCDGFLYSGDRETPYVYNGSSLYFRGRSILYGALELMKKESKHFANASTVLLTGGSAGGYGTFIHSQALSEWISVNVPSAKKVRSAPLSGFFLSRENWAFQEFIWETLSYMAPIANITSSLNPTCLQDAPPGLQSYCAFAATLYGYTTVPTFVLNSKMDAWQIACTTLGGPSPSDPHQFWCNQAPTYVKTKCAQGGSLATCSELQMRPLKAFQHSFMNSLSEVPTFRKPGNGAFIDSCLTHVASQNDESWTQTTINGVTMGNAFYNWWMDTNPWTPANVHTYIDCDRESGAECNPTCVVTPLEETDLPSTTK